MGPSREQQVSALLVHCCTLSLCHLGSEMIITDIHISIQRSSSALQAWTPFESCSNQSYNIAWHVKFQNTDQNYHLLSRSWSNYTNCLDKEDASFLLTINQVLNIGQGTFTLKTKSAAEDFKILLDWSVYKVTIHCHWTHCAAHDSCQFNIHDPCLYICNVEGYMKMVESGWCWLGDMDEVDKNR